MKKSFTSFILFILVLQSIFTSTVFAEETSISVIINNEAQQFDQEPVMINGTTMVPLRGIFETLGATVTWEPQTKSIRAHKGQISILLAVGQSKASVNEVQISLSQPAQIINGSTMVPLRFVSEALGGKVEWDGPSKTITITAADQNESTIEGNDEVTTSKEFNETDGSLIYEGQMKNGMYHGQGTYYSDFGILFIGEFVEGEIVEGKAYDQNERLIYEGEFVEFAPHGNGKLYEQERISYEGKFDQGKREGLGKEFRNDGSLEYEGTYKSGVKEGTGTTYYPNGNKMYEGTFSKNDPHGKGKYYNENGSLIYEGDFVRSYKNGNGILYFQNGDRLEGEFKDDAILSGTFYDAEGKEIDIESVEEGIGRFYFENGDLYIGSVKNGNIHGEGTYYEYSGRTYTGNHSDGVREGEGNYYRADGSLFYHGEFKEDVYHGKGTIYTIDEVAMLEGDFDRGMLQIDKIATLSKAEKSTIQSIQENVNKVVIDGMYSNDFGLSSEEAVMILNLTSEEEYQKFVELSHQGRVELVNSYVQDHWGDVLGVDYCYTFVKYKGNSIIGTAIQYEMENDEIRVYYYPN